MRAFYIGFLLMILGLKTQGQLGLWSSASAQVNHGKKWQTEIQLLHRYQNNNWSASGFAISEDLKIKKYLFLNFQYRWTAFANPYFTSDNQSLGYGNRGQLSINWKILRSKKDSNRFLISWKNALQFQHLNYSNNPLVFRSRIKVSSPKLSIFRLNAKAEYFYRINAVGYWNDDQWIQYGLPQALRYTADIDIKCNDHTTLNIGYTYSNRFSKQDRNWINLSIIKKLSKAKGEKEPESSEE